MKEEELEQVYRSQFDRVYRFALALTGNKSSAEEIAQESFLRLFQNGSRQRIENVQAWLIRVARNVTLDRVRAGSGETAVLPETAQANPEAECYSAELQHRILQALDRLSATQKECICLREFADLSYREIAEVVGISLDQVKVQLFRARQNLKAKLGGVL